MAPPSSLLLLVLFPFVWLVQMSFRPNTDILGYELALHAHARALPGALDRGVPRLLRQQHGHQRLPRPCWPWLIGVPAAYALSRGGFKSSRRIALWILATRMAPPIAFTIPFFLAYRYLGLSDTLSGLIIVYLTFNLALVIWMMQPFFDGVPRELEEAAWIDGCGVWEAFCRVTLPLSAPGLAATAVICFILSWNDFFYALVLTRTNASTAPVAIVNFIQYTGLGVGPHRRRGNAGDAAGGRLLDPGAQLPGARPRRRRRQGIMRRYAHRFFDGASDGRLGGKRDSLRLRRGRRRLGGQRRRRRLSESGRLRVLLLEAGEDDPWIWLKVPLGAGRSCCYRSAACGASIPSRRRILAVAAMFWPRGRVLGGSSTINGMLWVRGEPAEYDHWRELGNPGWGYADVLPFLKRMEAYGEGDAAVRGKSGPVIYQPLRPQHAGRGVPRGLR